jgi:hypothetical protein
LLEAIAAGFERRIHKAGKLEVALRYLDEQRAAGRVLHRDRKRNAWLSEKAAAAAKMNEPYLRRVLKERGLID